MWEDAGGWLLLISLAFDWLDLLWDSCPTCRSVSTEKLSVLAAEGPGAVSHKASEPAAPEPHQSAGRKRWRIAAGDSLLPGTEVPVCWLDPPSRDRLLAGGLYLGCGGQAVKAGLAPCYPLQFFHLGIINTARRDLQHIKCDCTALGVRAEGKRAQVIFTSFLPVKESGLRTRGWILWVNNRSLLCNSCQQQGFSFHISEEQGLLRRDRIYLTKWGESIFANRLA